jgi:hypothetical protein
VGEVLGKLMTTKNKNILTAVILIAISVIVYLFAVTQAVTQ